MVTTEQNLFLKLIQPFFVPFKREEAESQILKFNKVMAEVRGK